MNINSFEKYRISEVLERELFANAVFFFDTSSLLDFYFYSDQAKQDIFDKVFKNLKDRLWIANHTQFEFLKNREKVLLKPITAYQTLIQRDKKSDDGEHIAEIQNIITKIRSESIKSCKGQIQTLKEKTSKTEKHPYFDNDVFSDFEVALESISSQLNVFEESFTSFKEKLEEESKKKIDLLSLSVENDSVIKEFEKIFEVTREFSFNEILTIVEDGHIRVTNKIPPGYLDFDEDKVGFQQYGDLICWKQIIEKAKELNKPIILINNDVKEDWWEYTDKNQKIKFPRYELVKEMESIAEVKFWMYDMNEFLYKSNLYLSTRIQKKTIQEVEKQIAELHEDNILTDFLLKYFNIGILTSDFHPDREIAFIGGTESGENIGFVYKRKYNSGLINFQASLYRVIKTKKSKLKNNNVNKLVLILDYVNSELAFLGARHLDNKEIMKLIVENKKDFRLILGYRKYNRFNPIFDSEIFMPVSEKLYLDPEF